MRTAKSQSNLETVIFSVTKALATLALAIVALLGLDHLEFWGFRKYNLH